MNKNNINWNDWDVEEYEFNKLKDIRLVKFLKDNNVYDKFIDNFNILDYKSFCDYTKQMDYFDSFNWKETNEGYEFLE
jgi:hypothetical protein